jgi:hypothetical protein
MKKEYFLIFCVSLLILSYVIDYISGPFAVSLKNPYLFLNQNILASFPLTAVGVFARSLGIFIAIILILSLINKMFFFKTITTFLIAVLFNLFSIQQIATNTRTVTLQWSLSLAFSGLILILPALIYLIQGFIHPLTSKIIIPTTDDQKTSD